MSDLKEFLQYAVFGVWKEMWASSWYGRISATIILITILGEIASMFR